MKYYSEKTNALYNNIELLQDAEKEFDEKHALELKKKEVSKVKETLMELKQLILLLIH